MHPKGWYLHPEFVQYDDYHFEQLRNGESQKFLVVDDDPDSAIYLGRLIEKMFPRSIVHTAVSVEETRRLAETVDYDHAIVDLNLFDKIDGVTVCENLRRRSPRTKATIVSSLPRYEFQELCWKRNVDLPFLEKPVSSKSLETYLRYR